MFEYIEKKSEAKGKKITVRFTESECEFMKKYVEDESTDVKNNTELIRKALKNYFNN